MWIKTHLLMEARDGEKVEQVLPNGFHYLLKISGKMVGLGLWMASSSSKGLHPHVCCLGQVKTLAFCPGLSYRVRQSAVK